jgi:O-antigen ligase
VSALLLHRVVLFFVGATMLAGTVAIVPGLITVNKGVTGLLAASVAMQLMLTGLHLPRGATTVWVLALLLSVAFGFVVAWVYGVPPKVLLITSQAYVLTIVFYFLLLLGLRSMSDIRALLWGLAISASIASTSVLLGFRAAPELLDPFRRTGGLAGDANYFALGASIGLATSVFLAMSTRSWISRLVLSGMMAVTAGGVISSFSRGGYLALALMAALFLYRYGMALRFKLVVPVLLVIAILPLTVPERVIERVETVRTAGQWDTSIQGRLAQYQRALELFRSSPIWGVGLMRSNLSQAFGGAVVRQDLRALSGRGGYSVIHNSYLLLAAELGLLGLVPYLAITLLSWLGFSRVWRLQRGADPEDRSRWELAHLAVMMQIALLGGIVAGMFLNATRYRAIWVLFALSTVVVSLARQSAATEPEPAYRPRWQKARA